MQLGSIREDHGSWQLRYYRQEKVDGVIKNVRRQLILGRVEEMSEKVAQGKANDFMASINKVQQTATSTITFGAYVPKFLASIEHSNTLRFYRQQLNHHVVPVVGHIRFCDFQTHHAKDVLDRARKEDKTKLSQQSLLRIKTAMSAVFSHAMNAGVLDRESNPVREAKVEGGKKGAPDTYAYTLEEIEFMLTKLPEPARTLVAVAGYTGLRQEELRGLQWGDIEGDQLFVRRVLWGWTNTPEEPKTDASKAPVQIVPQLVPYLKAHRRNRLKDNPWMFPGVRDGNPLNLENLAARVIKPILGDKWHGWHSFRRGLTTTLYNEGVSVEAAQLVMRHANPDITRKHYLRLDAAATQKAAFQALSARLGRSMGSSKGKNRAGNAKRKIKNTA